MKRKHERAVLFDEIRFIISPNGVWKYVGKWKDGKKNGQGTYTSFDGRKYVGEFKGEKEWNGIYYDKTGNIEYKKVNGKYIKQ